MCISELEEIMMMMMVVVLLWWWWWCYQYYDDDDVMTICQACRCFHCWQWWQLRWWCWWWPCYYVLLTVCEFVSNLWLLWHYSKYLWNVWVFPFSKDMTIVLTNVSEREKKKNNGNQQHSKWISISTHWFWPHEYWETSKRRKKSHNAFISNCPWQKLVLLFLYCRDNLLKHIFVFLLQIFIFENLLQAGTMKALRMKTAAHKRRRRRIKCAKKGKNKPNLENSNFLNLSQRSGVLTASGWFGGRHTSPRPRSCIRWSSLRSWKNTNIGNKKWGINKQEREKFGNQNRTYKMGYTK